MRVFIPIAIYYCYYVFDFLQSLLFTKSGYSREQCHRLVCVTFNDILTFYFLQQDLLLIIFFSPDSQHLLMKSFQSDITLIGLLNPIMMQIFIYKNRLQFLRNSCSDKPNTTSPPRYTLSNFLQPYILFFMRTSIMQIPKS